MPIVFSFLYPLFGGTVDLKDDRTFCSGSLSSVVRQTVDNLFSLARARLTFSKMSDAFAVQMNGFGSAL